MAKQALPKEISDQITRVLQDMEKREPEALRKEEGPNLLESVEPLWYVAYKTEAV